MTIEERILNLLEEIVCVAKEYEPDTEYLSMSLVDGSVSINNEYFEHDPYNKDDHFKKIDFRRELTK